MPSQDNRLIVPTGERWESLKRLYPLLEGCRIVYVSDDAPGFFINEQETEMTLKLPKPTITATATCNADGTITFTFEIQ